MILQLKELWIYLRVLNFLCKTDEDERWSAVYRKGKGEGYLLNTTAAPHGEFGVPDGETR